MRGVMLCSIFFSRPPKAKLALCYREASQPLEEYKLCTPMQEKNAVERKFFSGASRTFLPLLLLSKRARPLLVGLQRVDVALGHSRHLWEPPGSAVLKWPTPHFILILALEDSPA